MRPIPTSGSCSSLVDVAESDSKLVRQLQTVPPTSLDCVVSSSGEPSCEKEFVETNLFLPACDDLAFDCYDDEEDDECDTPWLKSANSSLASRVSQQEKLHIPSSSTSDDDCDDLSMPLDKYLRSMPSLVERAEELQAQPARLLCDKTTSDQKVLNICQGEIGHATASQADIIVSDRATTCHIIAVRSTSSDFGSSEPLVSLCHLDKAQYEECLRDMIEMHKTHHDDLDSINMDLHLLGGYSDPDGSSLAITEHLLQLFGQISVEEKDNINMTLKTCAISCLNDNGFGAPIGRGLAMDLKSGNVFLAAVDDTVSGPAPTLRAARLWSTAPRTKLAIAHTPYSNDIIIEPFHFERFKALDVILSLPDEIMLQYTSTSPDVEDDQFCNRVRSTLRFIRDNSPEDIFCPDFDQQLVHYSRSKNNDWNDVA